MPSSDGPPAPDEVPLTCSCARETGCDCATVGFSWAPWLKFSSRSISSWSVPWFIPLSNSGATAAIVTVMLPLPLWLPPVT